MKFTENSLVVDVVKISNSSYKLSVPAGDLLTAAMNGAVLRRHDLSTAAVPNVLYVPLSEAKLSSGTYTFTFASGDKFTASAADAYPAASSVSDKTDSELPSVGTSDKNKFLHTNDSTGALEWAEGGSGGLPTPTAEDVGKVATVVEEISKGTVIAAEQTVTLNSKTGTGYIDNVDKSLMTNGAILIVTIEDVEYVVTCVADPVIKPITCGSFTIETSSESKLLISALGVAEPIDVAINLGVASYSWQPAVSGGGVLVVNVTPSEDTFTLDKTWEEIKDADAVSVVFDVALEYAHNFFFCSSVIERVPLGGGDTEYVVKVWDFGNTQFIEFIASSESGYPSYTYE